LHADEARSSYINTPPRCGACNASCAAHMHVAMSAMRLSSSRGLVARRNPTRQRCALPSGQRHHRSPSWPSLGSQHAGHHRNRHTRTCVMHVSGSHTTNRVASGDQLRHILARSTHTHTSPPSHHLPSLRSANTKQVPVRDGSHAAADDRMRPAARALPFSLPDPRAPCCRMRAPRPL